MAGAATAGSSESADLRAPIAASWERSQAAGVDPFVERVAPAVADADEVAARWEVHALSAMAPLIRQYVGEAAGDAQGIIVVTDAQGTVLWIDGDPNVRFDAAGMINLQEGASWSEADAGTNAIGIGLAAQHAVQVFATEHFNEVVHAWVCAAAPVRDPERGELLGIIDVTGRSSHCPPLQLRKRGSDRRSCRGALAFRDACARRATPIALRGGDWRGGRRVLVSTTGRILSSHPDGWLSAERLSVPPEGGELVLPSGARAFAEPVGHAEAYIVHDDQASRARPRPVLKLRLLGEGAPLAELGGRAFRLSPRHAEVLALLSSHSGGMTSEELAADLYGDRGRPGAARVEMSRLRKLLGGGIDADAYRLTIDTESDLAHVRTMLDRGEIRAAVEQ